MALLAAGDLRNARSAMLKQALAAEPNNPAFKLEYADVLVLHRRSRSGDAACSRRCRKVPKGATAR